MQKLFNKTLENDDKRSRSTAPTSRLSHTTSCNGKKLKKYEQMFMRNK